MSKYLKYKGAINIKKCGDLLSKNEITFNLKKERK